jgi:GDPmannose 4,6-dehydratase
MAWFAEPASSIAPAIDATRAEATKRGQVFELHYGDLIDASSIARALAKIRPDELYNLGGQSHVGVSFEEPEYTAMADAVGVLRLLEASATSARTRDSTRRHRVNCSAIPAASPPTRQQRSIRARPTPPRSSTRSGRS